MPAKKGVSEVGVDERIWEAWLRKNRKKDRVRVVRLQIIGFALVFPIAGVVFWWLAT